MKTLILLLAFALSSASFAQGQQILVRGGQYVPLYGVDRKPVRVGSLRIDEYPVTNGDFLAFVRSHPEWRRSTSEKLFADSNYLRHWKSDLELGPLAPEKSPVVNVSWYAAKAYCESEGARLPTVDEWEYVASRPIEGHPAKEVKKLDLDWYALPNPEVLPPVTTAVSNSAGISGLHGLIWEWTLDFNSAMVTGESRTDGALDQTLFCGAGSLSASDKTDYAAFLRYGFRSSLQGNYAVANLGFRCVKGSSGAVEAANPPLPGDSIYRVRSRWTDQDGHALALSSLVGNPVALSMVYLTCKYACPLTVERMKELEKALPPKLKEKMRFVLVSFDPARDTPGVMRKYMTKAHLSTDRWKLITTSREEDLRELAALLDFKYKRLSSGEFQHSFGIVALDPEGRILATTIGTEMSEQSLIASYLRALGK